jgi:hypothetical protein
VAIASAFGLGFTVIIGVQRWLGKKVESIWEDEVWDAARFEETKSNDTSDRLPEYVA